MGKADYYLHGSYNAICDTCGFKYKANQLRMTWDGFFVCNPCWEPRQPQDFVRSKVDKMRVPIARPDDTTIFSETQLNADENARDSSINVVTLTGMEKNSPLLILLDGIMGMDGVYHSCTITTAPVVSTNILIDPPLLGAASTGNTIYVLDGTGYLQDNEVQADDL